MPNWVENKLTMAKADSHLVLNKEQCVDFNILVRMPPSLNTESSTDGNTDVYLYLSNRNQIPLDAMKQTSSAQHYFNADSNPFVLSCLKRTFNEKIEAAHMSSKKLLDTINSMPPETLAQNLANNDYYNIDARVKHGETIFRNEIDYGAPTWYEWSLQNWGCKWNASKTHVEDANDDPNSGMITISFDTPWSPPEAWLKSLSARNIDFRCDWHEESGYEGIYRSTSGEFTSEDTTSYDDEEDEDSNCVTNYQEADVSISLGSALLGDDNGDNKE